MQKNRGGAQDPVVAALGQHDVAAVTPGPLQEPVLKHQRRHDFGRAHLQQLQKRGSINVLLEQGQRAGVFARRFGGQAASGLRNAQRRVVGAQAVLRDRQRRVQPGDQPFDLRRQRKAAVQDDSRNRREGRRGVS